MAQKVSSKARDTSRAFFGGRPVLNAAFGEKGYYRA